MRVKKNLKNKLIIFPLIFIFLLYWLTSSGYAKNGEVKSSLQNRLSVGLTIYNQNFALVREKRNLSLLPKQKQEILFEDVPVQIEPDTVFIEGNKDFHLLEQKFEYDLITPDKLMEKYVGKRIKILDKNQKTGESRVFEAELVSYNNNQAIYRIGGEIYLDYPGTVILPDIPEQLRPNPTLRWLIDNRQEEAQEKTIEVSYLTRGINWKVDYVLHINPNETQGDLLSWVTIENQSGARFEKAEIKLVAGDVQRPDEVGTGQLVRRMKMAEAMDEPESTFQEESVSEYHLYTLAQALSLKDQQTTNVPFLTAIDIPVAKEFIFTGAGIYTRVQTDFLDKPRSVRVYLKLENKKEQKLGFPLPQGSIKVYQRGRSGSLEFIGEDLLSHTPEGETMRLLIGSAFDVTGIQKQMVWERIGNRSYESEWQVKIKNQKEEKVLVRVIEPIEGEWKILSSSHSYTRLDAQKIEFPVTVSAKGEETLTYRIRVEF